MHVFTFGCAGSVAVCAFWLQGRSVGAAPGLSRQRLLLLWGPGPRASGPGRFDDGLGGPGSRLRSAGSVAAARGLRRLAARGICLDQRLIACLPRWPEPPGEPLMAVFTCFDYSIADYLVWYKYIRFWPLLVDACLEYLFRPFTFSLYVSLKLQWVFITDNRSFFFKPIWLSCVFWLKNLDHLCLKWLLIGRTCDCHSVHCFLTVL